MDNNSASEHHNTDHPQHQEQGLQEVGAVADEVPTADQASSMSTSYPAALLDHPQLSRRVNWPVKQASILQLQRFIGNRATQRFLQRSIRQISSPSPARLPSGPNTIQRVARTETEQKLTQMQRGRWTRISESFMREVVDKSPLAQGNENQVILWGVSKTSHPAMQGYASTVFYIANGNYSGFQKGDHDKFTEVWNYQPQASNPPADVTIRIVIFVNLSEHRNDEELYTTLLHEWYMHAAEWKQTVDSIRSNQASQILSQVLQEGSTNRENREHAQYANMGDPELEGRVKSLGLSDEQTEKVLEKIKEDRDRYDKTTGIVGPTKKKQGVKRKAQTQNTTQTNKKKKAKKQTTP